MNAGAFIGGVLTGVLGLAAIAVIDKQLTEGKLSPKFKSGDELDEEQAIRELNNFFFKAQAIYGKCNEIVLEASDLIVTPVEFPWDGLAQKAMNSLGCAMTRWSRNGRTAELLDQAQKVSELYTLYLPVFEQANGLLARRGLSPVILIKNLSPEELDRPDNSMDNDDWDIEFGELADGIINFIEKSCALAEQLIDSLEGSPQPELKAIAL